MKTESTIIKVGKAKVLVSHSNFKYYQPNVHKTTDCAVRACCVATFDTWFKVYDGLCEEGRKLQVMPNDNEAVGAYLKKHGFEWVAIKPEKGMKRPIVADFADSHLKPCVMSVAGHFVGSAWGNYYDIWDCGDCSLYGYWIKK